LYDNFVRGMAERYGRRHVAHIIRQLRREGADNRY
jgi:hypothetical protein